jgi:hypothetical protein
MGSAWGGVRVTGSSTSFSLLPLTHYVKLTPCGRTMTLDIFHGFAITPWAPKRGHAPSICPTEFGCTNSHINNGFIDPHLFTADRATIAVLLRRRAAGFVQGCRWALLVVLATHISPFLWPAVPQRCPHIAGAIFSRPPSRLGSADSVRARAPSSADTVGGRSGGQRS